MSYDRRQFDKRKHQKKHNDKSRHSLHRTIRLSNDSYDGDTKQDEILGRFRGGRSSVRVSEISGDD